jgi:hypothetical protein
MQVYFDIKPGGCPNLVNLKAKGVLPVAVLGTHDFNVRDIDPATLRLTREGVSGEVAAIRWSYGDAGTPFTGALCGCNTLGPDGHTDLNLKFTLQEVAQTLNLSGIVGNSVELVLTGSLKEGTPIRGADCVKIHKRDGSTHDGSMPSAGFDSGDQIGIIGGAQILFSFYTTDADHVRLDIFDVHGRVIKNLVDESMDAGSHLVAWNKVNDSGEKVPAGIYFVRFSTRAQNATKKVVVVD